MEESCVVRGRRAYHRIPVVYAKRLADACTVLEGPWPPQNPPELLRWQAAMAFLGEFHRTHE